VIMARLEKWIACEGCTGMYEVFGGQTRVLRGKAYQRRYTLKYIEDRMGDVLSLVFPAEKLEADSYLKMVQRQQWEVRSWEPEKN